MTDALPFIRARARLDAGEPIHVLIGEKLYDAAEIVMLAPAEAARRATLSADLARQIAALTEPPPEPSAPARALEGAA